MSLNAETIPTELTTESLMAQSVTANVTDLDGADIKEYLGKLKVVLNAGTAANNNQAAAVTLQESDEPNANFTAFDPAIAFDAIAANGGATVQSVAVDTRAAKRYLRAHVVAANGNGRAVSVTITGKKQVTA